MEYVHYFFDAHNWWHFLELVIFMAATEEAIKAGVLLRKR